MSGAILPTKLRGFTLVEMMVVLMIMGILLGLVSVNIRPGEQDLLRLEAERLAQLLDLAANESRSSGKPLAWTADGSGYRFWRRDVDDEWAEIRDNDLLRARRLPPGMTISALHAEGLGRQASMRVEIAPGGISRAFTIDLSLGSEAYAVASSPVGDLRVAPGAGRTHAQMAPT